MHLHLRRLVIISKCPTQRQRRCASRIDPNEIPPPVMLAHSYNPRRVDQKIGGWYWSEKLDGIRAYWSKGRLKTRNGLTIPVPNMFVTGMREVFGRADVDGELYARRNAFQKTMGAVMKATQQHPDEMWRLRPQGDIVKFVAFDVCDRSTRVSRAAPFTDRLAEMRQCEVNLRQQQLSERGRRATQHIAIIKYGRLNKLEAKARETVQDKVKGIVAGKGEGLMVRRPDSPYTQGRSFNLLKVKTTDESEALVVDWAEGLGKHHGWLGALRCKLLNGVHFEVGSGFTDACRYDVQSYIGKVITVRHQGNTTLGVPRFPTFVGVRLDRSPREFEMLSGKLGEMMEP